MSDLLLVGVDELSDIWPSADRAAALIGSLFPFLALFFVFLSFFDFVTIKKSVDWISVWFF